MHRKGAYAGHKYDDAAWTGLDHESCVREAGRRYRPASLANRPKVSEGAAGKPKPSQGDLFDGVNGRAATRLSDAADLKERDRTQTHAPDSVRSQAARFLAWRAERG